MVGRVTISISWQCLPVGMQEVQQCWRYLLFWIELIFQLFSHVEFIESKLLLYVEISLVFVCCCWYCPAIANNLEVPFVGWESYWFNLPAEAILASHSELLPRVNEIMKKFKTPYQAAKLRQKTDIIAVTFRVNQTRWTAKIELFERYLKMFYSIEQITTKSRPSFQYLEGCIQWFRVPTTIQKNNQFVSYYSPMIFP